MAPPTRYSPDERIQHPYEGVREWTSQALRRIAESRCSGIRDHIIHLLTSGEVSDGRGMALWEAKRFCNDICKKGYDRYKADFIKLLARRSRL